MVKVKVKTSTYDCTNGIWLEDEEWEYEMRSQEEWDKYLKENFKIYIDGKEYKYGGEHNDA